MQRLRYCVAHPLTGRYSAERVSNMDEKIIKKVLAMICEDFQTRKKAESLTIDSYRFDAFLFAEGKLASSLKGMDC